VSNPAAIGHANPPTELDLLDVAADHAPIVNRQGEQPFPYWLATSRSEVEAGDDLLRPVDHPRLLCQNWHASAIYKPGCEKAMAVEPE
jgi:hypothetical protein